MFTNTYLSSDNDHLIIIVLSGYAFSGRNWYR